MSQGRPRLFSPAQCAELWRLYKAGESILGIGRVLVGLTDRSRRPYRQANLPAGWQTSAVVECRVLADAPSLESSGKLQPTFFQVSGTLRCLER